MNKLFSRIMLLALVLVAAIALTGCGKDIKLNDTTVQSSVSTLKLQTPVELKEIKKDGAGNNRKITIYEGHNSDFQVTVTSVAYDRAAIEKKSGKAWTPDLDKSVRGMADNIKKTFKASAYKITDTTVAGLPAEQAVMTYTSKEIKLKLTLVGFYAGDEFWGISVACRDGDEDMAKIVDKIIKSIGK